MNINFKQIDYRDLNGRQQEAYNFQKLSDVLADFGFVTIPLSNDWNGADFLLQDSGGTSFHKVQLKSRLTFDAKYCSKGLYVCFRDGERGPWYMYDHDELLEEVDPNGKIRASDTWKSQKPYHFSTLSTELKRKLEPFRIPGPVVSHL